MAKKKQKDLLKKVTTWLRKFWSIPLILVALVVYGLVQLASYLTVKPFNDTYEQLKNAYGSLLQLQGEIEGTDSILKICRNIGAGFTVEVECGVHLNMSFKGHDSFLTDNLLRNILNESGFKSIDIASGDQQGLDGTTSFYSANGMVCGGYWEFSNQRTIVDLYCRKDAPYYLPGYEKE